MPRKTHPRIIAHHRLVKASKSYAEYTKKAPEQGFGVHSRDEFDRIRAPRLGHRRT